jgi:hypothetical protein
LNGLRNPRTAFPSRSNRNVTSVPAGILCSPRAGSIAPPETISRIWKARNRAAELEVGAQGALNVTVAPVGLE